MRIYELVPLRPTMDGYHDASGYICGGVVLPVPTSLPLILTPQLSAARTSPNPTAAHPVVRRAPFPKYVVYSLVIWKNQQGTVNNSKLEPTGAIIHGDCLAQCFVVTEHTVLSRTDNTAGLWWKRKCSVNCTSTPTHLLRLQAMHQRFYRYVPHIYFVNKLDNTIQYNLED